MKKRLKFVIWGGVILLILIIIVLPKMLQSRKGTVEKQRKAVLQQAVRVKVMVIKPGRIQEYLKTTGTLLADEEVDLAFDGQGKIETIFFREGTYVHKGQILAKLNDDELQAQLMKLNLQNNLLQEKVDRQKVLLEREAISQESYDQLKTDLQSNEAEIKLVLVQIDKTEIKAPFDGIIGLRYVSEGAYVSHAGVIKVGSELDFHLDNSTEEYTASVYAMEPAVDPATRTMTLRALFPNKDAKLYPGRFVSVLLIIHEKNDALQVPTEAIIPELGGEKVFTVVNGRAASNQVTTGMRTPEAVEITGGLKPGDSVVVSGIMQLRADMPVTVLAEDSVENKNSLP
jgi:membrane fusion protein (multidrug efflux system)